MTWALVKPEGKSRLSRFDSSSLRLATETTGMRVRRCNRRAAALRRRGGRPRCRTRVAAGHHRRRVADEVDLLQPLLHQREHAVLAAQEEVRVLDLAGDFDRV